MIEGHGGNIYKLAGELGCKPAQICDMSANVNPLGPMPDLVAYLQQEILAISALPEVNADQIVQLFSQNYNVDPRELMAGNGSTELIYLIPRALKPGKALIVGPTYADYEDSCKMNRVPYRYFTCKKERDFEPDMQALQKAASDVDLVFLCNPNNPTGGIVSHTKLTTLCSSLPETLFVIDESYLPFVPQPDEYSLIRTDLSNVIVLNSMSKAFRIPGLRIGFVKAPEPILEQLRGYTLPWSVNSLAQTAVSWLMSNADQVNRFLEKTRTRIEEQRSEWITRIEKKTRINCFPSVTSFTLMHLPEALDAKAVWEHMARNRILIRNCSNFEGLSDRYIRISLKSEKENRKAADLLIQFDREHDDDG
jgi:threonine-phosphate decarboxylase